MFSDKLNCSKGARSSRSKLSSKFQLKDQTKKETCYLLVLPYAGNKGGKILKLMNKFSSYVLPCNVKTCIAYSKTKLSSKFHLKDQMKKDHLHDAVYYVKWPEEQCTEIKQEKQEGV